MKPKVTSELGLHKFTRRNVFFTGKNREKGFSPGIFFAEIPTNVFHED